MHVKSDPERKREQMLLPSSTIQEKLQTAIDAGAMNSLNGLYLVNSLLRALAMAKNREATQKH